jgi:hypothetical protein
MTYGMKNSKAMSRSRRIHPAEGRGVKEEKNNGTDKI